jgi:predicted acylesterase/phospholipase RssA
MVVVMCVAGVDDTHAQPMENPSWFEWHQAPDAEEAPDTSPRRFGMTISGGVSLGAYEAGVNWVLFQHMRSPFDAKWSKKPLELVGVTGASAGNINAFLMAVHWCENDDTFEASDAKNNWFWRTWVNVGFQQLFPGGSSAGSHEELIGMGEDYTYASPENVFAPSPTDAWGRNQNLLSRRGMEPIMKALVEAWSDPSRFLDTADRSGEEPGAPRTRCQGEGLPVGVTLTSTYTQMESTTSSTLGIDLPTARRVVIVRVKTNEDGKLYFENYFEPDVEYDDPDLFNDIGDVIVLATSRPDSNEIDPGQIIALTAAASAFPGAFAPVKLGYLEHVPVTSDDGMPTSTFKYPSDYSRPTGFEYFYDGGIFDNLPLSTMFWLAKQDEDPARGRAVTYYIDPDSKRGVPSSACDDAGAGDGDEDKTRVGVDNIAAFLGAVFSLGAKYELIGLSRRRAPSLNDHVDLRVTDRFARTNGEFWLAFTAFLVRPFREYDFHIGAYDGLRRIFADELEREVFREDPTRYASIRRALFLGLLNHYFPVGGSRNNADTRFVALVLFELEEARLRGEDVYARYRSPDLAKLLTDHGMADGVGLVLKRILDSHILLTHAPGGDPNQCRSTDYFDRHMAYYTGNEYIGDGYEGGELAETCVEIPSPSAADGEGAGVFHCENTDALERAQNQRTSIWKVEADEARNTRLKNEWATYSQELGSGCDVGDDATYYECDPHWEATGWRAHNAELLAAEREVIDDWSRYFFRLVQQLVLRLKQMDIVTLDAQNAGYVSMALEGVDAALNGFTDTFSQQLATPAQVNALNGSSIPNLTNQGWQWHFGRYFNPSIAFTMQANNTYDSWLFGPEQSHAGRFLLELPILAFRHEHWGAKLGLAQEFSWLTHPTMLHLVVGSPRFWKVLRLATVMQVGGEYGLIGAGGMEGRSTLSFRYGARVYALDKIFLSLQMGHDHVWRGERVGQVDFVSVNLGFSDLSGLTYWITQLVEAR